MLVKSYRPILVISGVFCFCIALFQIVIGFSPSLSLYFGAPEALAANRYSLIAVSMAIGLLLGVFGLYALSGAGCIRVLPWLKHVLAVISGIFILRGLLVVPEAMFVAGIYESAINVAPRFVVFSIGSLLIGLIFSAGTIGGWRSFSSKS